MRAMLRVASYNIHKAIGTDRRRNPGRILDVLDEIDADIVALQEVDRRLGARASAIPPQMLDAHQSYTAVRFDTRPLSLGHHGNALFIKRTNRVLDCAALSIPSFEPRGAVVADIETEHGDVRIVGMHLDLSGLRRRQQIRAILSQIDARKTPMPTILMGDCNEWSPHGGSMTEFHGHHIAQTGPSFHSRRPMARLDRIVTCDRIKIHAAGAHHSLKARFASDHLPIWADVDLI
jgi:endonuclease/exonuclease/phosphatase family metal-dependent hydrolase